MAKFLTGNELNSELEKIFENAEEQLILVSPYIKLHDRYKSILQAKMTNHKLKIFLVFGKNENDRSKSIRIEDIDFFKAFPNIQIKYEKRLHAKYYANESSAILTSMNLYSYSHDHNIESGVLVKSSTLGGLANLIVSNVMSEEGVDTKAWNFFSRTIEQADLLFYRAPRYENTMLGLSKKYLGSETHVDKIAHMTPSRPATAPPTSPYTKSGNEPNTGYCIRTGSRIPFDHKQPMCREAYVQWAVIGKQDNPENYCHFSGEPSNGETSYARPILRKHWNRAKQVFRF